MLLVFNERRPFIAFEVIAAFQGVGIIGNMIDSAEFADNKIRRVNKKRGLVENLRALSFEPQHFRQGKGRIERIAQTRLKGL